MSEYELTVGLEIHVELETKSKMFCGCKNDPFRSRPNSNVCPVCYGLPGALPLINKKAVAMVAMLGSALGGRINRRTFFERKHYFYPDLPKGYQISQSVRPLVEEASLTIDGEKHQIQRIHLEEDAAKLTHAADGQSLVDYNRAGVPLIELVTYPDFHSAEAAKSFCQEFQRVVRHLKISQADMEKGQMRCEANISTNQKSIRQPADKDQRLGTKVEVKNINSFRAVERSIKYEFNRQVNLLESGRPVIQETRTWDEVGQKTKAMRVKETSADYRYFPEPDLPELSISLQVTTPRRPLPEQQRQVLTRLRLPKELVGPIVDLGLYDYVKRIELKRPERTVAAAKLLIDVPETRKLSDESLLKLIEAREKNGWAKKTVAEIVERAGELHSIEDALGEFSHVANLDQVVEQVIGNHPKAVADYKAGGQGALNYLIGQVMAGTRGRANVAEIRQRLQDRLK